MEGGTDQQKTIASFLKTTDQQKTIASFLKTALGQTAHSARRFLQATGRKLEEAIQLLYVRSRIPLHVLQQYEELKRYEIWGVDEGSTSAAGTSRDNLAYLYRPPYALMYLGSFEKAKEAAVAKNRWLLVNVQSAREFSSHMLNRDTWGNEVVAQTIASNFIFWQVCDDTKEGSKIITYYKLDSVPVTLVIDPITGQKMCLWRGMIQPESLLEDVLQYTDSSPKDQPFILPRRRPIGCVSVAVASCLH